MNKSTSPFASINWTDIKKTGLHFLIVALASFGLYMIDTVVPQIHFGGDSAILAILISTISDAGRRFLTNYTTQQ